MPRPRRFPNATLNFRLTEEDKAWLEREAERSALKPSDIARAAIKLYRQRVEARDVTPTEAR